MNWDSPEERADLIERVGLDQYNDLLKERLAALPSVYPVQTAHFGMLWAVKDTKSAFSTREAAEQWLRERAKK